MNKIKKKAEIIALVIIGLVPLLWFKGSLITGADINFSLDPILKFSQRLYAWNGVYKGGIDRAGDFATLFFYGIQTGFYLITHSLIWTEKLSFVFWFMLTGFSMYYLVSVIIFKGKNLILRMTVVIFYLINFYQLACWSGVHIAGITALAVLPVLFGLFIKIIEGEWMIKDILLFSIFSIISGGIFVNPPMIVICAFIILSYLFIYLLRSHNLKKVIIKCIVLGGVYVLLNSYILIPLVDSYRGGISSNPLADYNVIKYTEFQSDHSTPLNVLRLMGNSEWYSKWTSGEYYFPFFVKYMLRRLLILCSFILPVFAFMGGILRVKEKFPQYFFGLAVLGVLFGMGIHPPMENVYKWMLVHVPFFYLFRSPWLKFSLLTAFSYPILAGFCCEWFFEFTRKLFSKYQKARILISNGFIFGIITIYLIFMHSFILGEMFTTKDKRVELGPMHINVPDYVFSTAQWINKQRGDFAVALLPDEKTNTYEWGYGGIKDISLELLNKATLYREYGEMGAVPFMADMYSLFIKGLYNEITYNIWKFLNLNGIRYIIQRNDFRYYFYGDRDSQGFIKEKVGKQDKIIYETSFGDWDIYTNSQWKDDYISSANFSIYVNGDKSSLLPLSELEGTIFNNSVFLVDKSPPADSIKDLCLKSGLILMTEPEEQLLDWDGNAGMLLYNLKDENVLNGMDKKIWVPNSGIYNMYIKLKPKFTELDLKGSGEIYFSGKDILEWSYKLNNVEYKKNISEDKLLVETIFDGKEDEYVQIKNKNVEIDLEEYPWFIMDYMVDVPGIQIIEFVFGLDFNGDKQIDGYLRGFRTTDPTKGLKRFKLDVLNSTINRVPAQEMYKVVLIEFYCHKLWGVDCSSIKTKGNYRFWIKNVRFSRIKKKNMVEVYNTKLDYNQKGIKIKVLKITDKINRKYKMIRIRIPISKINLLKTPEIKTRYRIKYPSGVEAFEIFLRLYPKNNIGPEKLVFIGKIPIENKYSDYRINMLWFGDKLDLLKEYLLTGIEFKFGGEKLRRDVNDIIRIQNIKIFDSHFTNRWEKEQIESGLLGIGGKVINLIGFKSKDIIPKEIISTYKLHLNKGWNSLKLFLDRDNFLQCQWICILPELEHNGVNPSLDYEKINETMYRVKVKGGDRPFVFIMKDNYNPKWKAYVFKKPPRTSAEVRDRNQKPEWRELKEHFVANGFANAWLVSDTNEDMEIIIKYYPQDLFKFGFLISLVTFIGILCWVIKVFI